MDYHFHGAGQYNIDIRVVEVPDLGALARHKEVIARLERIEQGVTMANDTIAGLKKDLADVKQDLDEIKANLLVKITALQDKITAQDASIQQLTDAAALTDAGLADLKTGSTAVVDETEEIAASLRPAT